MNGYNFGDLRALTVQQPHAAAIVYGYKSTENRVWAPPRILEFPFTIAIHAGMKDSGRLLMDGIREYLPQELVHGAIVGLVNVTGVHRKVWGQVCCSDPWADNDSGLFHWQLTDASRLSVPVPVRGRQGLSRLDPDTVRAVAYQIRYANRRKPG